MRLIFIRRVESSTRLTRATVRETRGIHAGSVGTDMVSRGYWVPPRSASNLFDALRGGRILILPPRFLSPEPLGQKIVSQHASKNPYPNNLFS